MRIVYMGTPDFAVPGLEAIVQAGYEVVGVVTAPDKPAGRGQKLSQSAVKIAAEKLGLVVLQPEKLRAPEFIAALQALKPDVQVVVAFRMLPEIVWALPPMGTLNLHASLLPAYRGAAPINWAIIEGEVKTGLTTFFIEKEIDTGKIIFQTEIPILADETAGQLHDKMMQAGATLILKTLAAIKNQTAPAIPQPVLANAPKAPKIFTEDCQINWAQPAHRIYNFVRGLSPYPAAWTLWNGQILKIFFVSQKTPTNPPPLEPAKVLVEKNELYIAATNAWLKIERLKLEGRKEMSTHDFLNGKPAIPQFVGS